MDNKMNLNKEQQTSTKHSTQQDYVIAAAESHHCSKAAQAVFNTPELLEQILKQLPMDFLARGLSVSKYCQNVILGSADMRRTLFFEPAPAADFIQTCEGRECNCADSPACGHQEPIQWLDVKAHPLLKPVPLFIYDSFPSSPGIKRRYYLPYSADHEILCNSLDNAPASAFTFQPPSPEVRFFYNHKIVSIERSGGVTFGAIREELSRQRKESPAIVDSLTLMR